MKLIQKGHLANSIPLHVIIWGILFGFPLLFMPGDSELSFNVYMRVWTPIICSALIFYTNFFFLIDKLLLQHKTAWFIVVNISLIILCIYCVDVLREALNIHNNHLPHSPDWKGSRPDGHRPPVEPNHQIMHLGRIIKNAFTFVLTVGISVGVRVTQRLVQSESEKKNLENEKLKSELTHLRYQLQPHFFFNSLNNIYSLVDIDADKAKAAIHGLGKLMRYILNETKVERIFLSEEIEFLQNCSKLMALRLPAKAVLELKFPTVYHDREIAPLLFVSLLENAFKHGVSVNRPTSILIEMIVKDTNVVFITENTYYPKGVEDQSISGIGVVNLQKRLSLLYPGKYKLVQELQGDIFRSELSIDV